jgi:hypothetical protein
MTFLATRLDDVLGLETQVTAAWPRDPGFLRVGSELARHGVPAAGAPR